MPTWRERFSSGLGPGILAGITAGDWLKLLARNRFHVHPAFLLRALTISWTSLGNSLARSYEQWRYAHKLEGVEIQPPLFVLGHWRSGTTFLHDLLAVDGRFACPNLYQALHPHTFLSTERPAARPMRALMPQRRPHDHMRMDPATAWEDEFAMCAWGLRTPYLAWAFPRQTSYYDRFLTFRDAPPDDVEQWKNALQLFLKKLTLKHGKPLILKSPPHTGRIKLLLEMFPQARFVHICRDPYVVFQSSLHTYATVLPTCQLQHTNGLDWTERVLKQYRQLYDAFFEQRHLIPAGHYHEVCFEELEEDPVGEMAKLYEALKLPDFQQVEPNLRRYVQSLAGYRKNIFPELAPELYERIGREWRRCFEEWGYPL